MIWLAVALGGAAGGAARVLVDHHLRPADPHQVPWGILTCNVLGSFLLGLVVGAWPAGPAYALLGTGFCGALTTWSTFAVDLVRLTRGGRPGRALAYAAASVGAGWLAALAGLALTLG